MREIPPDIDDDTPDPIDRETDDMEDVDDMDGMSESDLHDEDAQAIRSPSRTTGGPLLEDTYTIVAEGLSKAFIDGDEEIQAVDHVTFGCAPAQFVTISGPSGCGKSTLLFLLGSLEQPTAGRLIVDGEEVTRLPPGELNRFRRRKVGFVFQSFHLVPNLSAVENVMLPMDIAGLPRQEQAERAVALLEQVGIDRNRHHHRPGKLSGGQQQRVAIARALANDPAVILADEPTGNLDSNTSKRIVELLRQLAHQGRTIVVVTHDLGIAKQADLSIELEDGRIIRMITREEREQLAQEGRERKAAQARESRAPGRQPARSVRSPRKR
jgi:ABC-type lipoprotein export system ATPase subunit